MKGTRFYKIVIALLILINVATLLFIWLRKPPHPPRPGDEPQLANEIGLTGDDKKVVDQLEIEHHTEKRKMMKRDTELHTEMFNLVGSEDNADSIQTLLNENKAAIEKMTFDFFDEVANYCNDEQLEALKQMIQERLVKMHRPPPHPRN